MKVLAFGASNSKNSINESVQELSCGSENDGVAHRLVKSEDV